MKGFPLTNFLVDLEVNNLTVEKLRANAMQKDGPYSGVKAEVMRGYLAMKGMVPKETGQ